MTFYEPNFITAIELFLRRTLVHLVRKPASPKDDLHLNTFLLTFRLPTLLTCIQEYK